MKFVLLLIGAGVFIFASAAHIYVRVKLRPKPSSDLDDYYWEFEDSHPAMARYNYWSQRTFAGAIIGALLLFLALIF